MTKYFMRRVHLIRRFPETGFVIFNPKAEKELNFYCKTTTTKTSRTTIWCETADSAKVFDNERSAKSVLSKMKKRSEKWKELKIVSIESLMIDGFEICMDSGEVRPCKAWPVEFNSKAVFKTKLEALNSEKEQKMKERASYILKAQDATKEIEKLEKEIQKENKNEN